ncbi:SsgA family sporulation/cell division regulator [Kitasatospora sp. NPDC091207]|uniref:SsgA family sporulation/cell division regulator n=1 Tax=Kitasatospora sp. NPDC091207 TaxID=3364083 RepID=UPI0037F53DC8
MTGRETPQVPPQRSGAPVAALDLDLRALVCPGLSVCVKARLRYDVAEPYAVYLDSHVDRADPITWMFARELLAAGVTRAVGIGDVSIRPGTGEDAGSVLVLLGGDEGSVVLRARTAEVTSFLARADRLVPPGREHEYVDLDGLVRRLLDHGRPWS